MVAAAPRLVGPEACRRAEAHPSRWLPPRRGWSAPRRAAALRLIRPDGCRRAEAWSAPRRAAALRLIRPDGCRRAEAGRPRGLPPRRGPSVLRVAAAPRLVGPEACRRAEAHPSRGLPPRRGWSAPRPAAALRPIRPESRPVRGRGTQWRGTMHPWQDREADCHGRPQFTLGEGTEPLRARWSPVVRAHRRRQRWDVPPPDRLPNLCLEALALGFVDLSHIECSVF